MYANFSIRKKLLVPCLIALFALVVGLTAFWETHYATKMNEGFASGIQLSTGFSTTPLATAVWDFDDELVEVTLTSLHSFEPFVFAQVWASGKIFGSSVKEGDWNPAWDADVAALLAAETAEPLVIDGPIQISRHSLIMENKEIGTLIVGYSQAGIQGEVRNANLLALGIGGIAFVGFAVLLYLVAQSVSSPLNEMVGQIDRLQAGDADIEIPQANRSDEIGKLGRALESFRTSILQSRQLESEKQEAEAAQQTLEKERAAEAEAKRAEEATQLERRAQEEKERIEAERETERKLADERQTHMQEQNNVVEMLATALHGLSEGNLQVTINSPFPSAYETLRHDFNEAVMMLAQAISQISDSGASIDTMSSNILNAAQELSKQATHNAATLEESAAALEELTGSVKATSQGAQQANAVVTKAKENAQASSLVVENTIEAMNEIQSSSAKITNIVDMIENIAFQTNLLALNAGVEAARAGDAGKGFAVVASEVRDLARRSSEAASEITQVISDSGQHVDRGAKLVAETGGALEGIIASVESIATQVSDIMNSAEEQSNGISEISSAVSEIDKSNQRNAASLDETASASAVLKEQSDKLAVAIAKFNLADLQYDRVLLSA